MQRNLHREKNKVWNHLCTIPPCFAGRTAWSGRSSSVFSLQVLQCLPTLHRPTPDVKCANGNLAVVGVFLCVVKVWKQEGQEGKTSNLWIGGIGRNQQCKTCCFCGNKQKTQLTQRLKVAGLRSHFFQLLLVSHTAGPSFSIFFAW